MDENILFPKHFSSVSVNLFFFTSNQFMLSLKTSDRIVIKNKFHEINKYIRDNIVSATEHKLLFVSSILIYLK